MPRFLVRSFGKSGSFNGSDNFLDIGTMGSLGSSLGSGISIGVHLRPSIITAMTVVGTRVTSTNMYLNFKINTKSGSNSKDSIQWQLVDASGNSLNGWATAPGLTAGGHKFIAVTCLPSENTLQIYYEGLPLTVTYTTQVQPTNFANFAHGVYFGALDNNGTVATPYYAGIMDEVTIWNSKLTASEVQSLYYNGSVSRKNPVSYHKFDEGTGSTVADSAGSNTGTWNGTLGSQWSTDVRMLGRVAV